MKTDQNNLRLPLIALLLTIFLFACKKDEKEISDDYYIKYAVESKTVYTGVKLITIIQDERNNAKELTIGTGKWEMTIGPVKNQYIAKLDVTKKGWTGSTENHLTMTLSIYISKNNGPFSLRVIDDNTSPRAKALITHTLSE